MVSRRAAGRMSAASHGKRGHRTRGAGRRTELVVQMRVDGVKVVKGHLIEVLHASHA
jgi:hypothetical protein